MAHAKCTACRARVWREGPATDDLCPGCGGELEAVGDLSELIGLRALRTRPPKGNRRPPDESARISAQIREAIASHDRERQRRIDADNA